MRNEWRRGSESIQYRQKERIFRQQKHTLAAWAKGGRGVRRLLIFIKKSLKTSLRRSSSPSRWTFSPHSTIAHFDSVVQDEFSHPSRRQLRRRHRVGSAYVHVHPLSEKGKLLGGISSKLCNDDTWKNLFICLLLLATVSFHVNLLCSTPLPSKKEEKVLSCCCSTLYINMKCYAFSLFYALFPLYYNFSSFSVSSLALARPLPPLISSATLVSFHFFFRNHFTFAVRDCDCVWEYMWPVWHDDFMGQS